MPSCATIFHRYEKHDHQQAFRLCLLERHRHIHRDQHPGVLSDVLPVPAPDVHACNGPELRTLRPCLLAVPDIHVHPWLGEPSCVQHAFPLHIRHGRREEGRKPRVHPVLSADGCHVGNRQLRDVLHREHQCRAVGLLRRDICPFDALLGALSACADLCLWNNTCPGPGSHRPVFRDRALQRIHVIRRRRPHDAPLRPSVRAAVHRRQDEDESAEGMAPLRP